jgi:hypothetical protein
VTLLVPTRGVEDWKVLLASPERQWRPGFSAMSAALSWEAAQGLPPEIAALLGPRALLLLAIPEHKVALPGRGRESQCDVFALVDLGSENCALAVEAKVEEPFGPTLADWTADASSGKRERLSAILDLLGAATPPPTLRYQLFHRTAAAILESLRFRTASAAMIVQSFSPTRRWFEDFAAFCEFLGMEARPDRPTERLLPSGRRLILGWASTPLPK